MKALGQMTEAIQWLERINAARFYDGTNIVDRFSVGDISFWSFQQYSLLAAIQTHLSQGNSSVVVPSRSGIHRGWVSITLYLKYGCAFVVSFFGILWARLRRVRVVLYDIERIDPISHAGSRLLKVYRYLDQERIPYMVCVHSLFGERFYEYFRNVRRPTIYLEVLDIMGRITGMFRGSAIRVGKIADEGMPDWILDIIKRHITLAQRSVWRARVSHRLFSFLKPAVFFTYDDVRHMNELLWGANQADVRTIMTQHGNFTYFVGLDRLPPAKYLFPDHFLVPSTYWRERLPHLSPLFAHYRSRLMISGWLGSQTTSQCDPCESLPAAEKRAILVPYEILSDYQSIRTFMDRATQKGFSIIFKLKPGTDRANQLERYGLDDGPRAQVEIVEHMNDDQMQEIGAAVGVYSTLLDEMILKCIPIGMLESDFPVFDDKVDSGLAVRIDAEDPDLHLVLRSLVATSSEELQKKCRRYASASVKSPEVLDALIN